MYKRCRINTHIMWAWLQFFGFVTLLALLGDSIWHSCDMSEPSFIALATAFIICGLFLQFLVNILRCCGFICWALPDFPVIKAILSAIYATTLLGLLIFIRGRCDDDRIGVLIGGLVAYIATLLSLCFQLGSDDDEPT